MAQRVIAIVVGVVSLLAFQATPPGRIKDLAVSKNKRFLQTADGEPFFWLGDTGWLMFQKLDRNEVEQYLENRRRKGFNVIQCMVLHTGSDRNFYGAPALVGDDPGRPNVTAGSSLEKKGEYDYWDHIDWAADVAARKGIYLAMVPAWGSIARSGKLNAGNVETYGRFLADRYKNRPNVIWLNGGDTPGDRNTEVWRPLGRLLRERDAKHLITYHPFGRTQSSTWFHNEPWLDFNMFQSGHRRYDQDDTPNAKGEDNWRYAMEDYAKRPTKPTLDGEPSYEGIPQGLHDWSQPLWTDKDVRRYAYWSIFAGSFGHTYGHAAIMAMRKREDIGKSKGSSQLWSDAMDDPGGGQVQHLKHLILSRPFFERVPDQTLIAGENGARYEYVAATRGVNYALVYTYTGRPFEVDTNFLRGKELRAWWFDPRNGSAKAIGSVPGGGTRKFTPPGSPQAGNDWVLVLDDATAQFQTPGDVATR